MNKFIVDGLVIAGIGIIGGGAYIGYKINDINNKVDILMSKIDEAGKDLPSPFVQTNILEKGMFASKGVYKITGEKEDKSVEFKITYEIKHGVLDIFKDKYPIIAEADLKTSEGIEKILKNNGKKMLDIHGEYQPNGILELNGISDTIATNHMREIIDISPINIALNLNVVSGDTKMSAEIKDVKTKNVKMNNVALGFEASLNDAFKGKGYVKLGAMKSKLASLEGLSTEYSGKKEKDMYHFDFKSEIKNISVLNEEKKSAKIDLSLEMKDNVLRKIYEKHKKSNEEQSMEEKRKDGIELLTNGFKFNINEVSYKDNKNKLLTKGFFAIDEQENKDKIDLENFLNYKVDISSEGDMNKSVVLLVSSLFADNDEVDFEALQNTPPTPINQSFSYKKGEMKVNNESMNEEKLNSFVSKLRAVSDSMNGVSQSEVESNGDEEENIIKNDQDEK